MNSHLIHDKGNNVMGERRVFSINVAGLTGYVKNTNTHTHTHTQYTLHSDLLSKAQT
mgnify:CR=1 FL=1